MMFIANAGYSKMSVIPGHTEQQINRLTYQFIARNGITIQKRIVKNKVKFLRSSGTKAEKESMTPDIIFGHAHGYSQQLTLSFDYLVRQCD